MPADGPGSVSVKVDVLLIMVLVMPWPLQLPLCIAQSICFWAAFFSSLSQTQLCMFCSNRYPTMIGGQMDKHSGA